jgi:subtilase family serine protease
MRCSSHPARLTRSRRAQLLAVALLLGVVLVAGCAGSSGSPGPAGAGPAAASGSAAAARPATAVVAGSAPASAVSGCPVQTIDQAPCYTPHQLLVAYGIQPVLDGGIDGRGETVTVLAPAPSPDTADITDIRQDLAAFNRMFGLPAARIQVVTTLAGSAAPWQAGGEEVGDTEIVHAVAPAATLRVVLMPSNVLASAATATADMIAGLRLAVSGTDVASISFSLGEHLFTAAQVTQMHSILLGAAAHHVTVIASSGDNGAASDTRWGGRPVKEVSLPASDPLVLGVGGTTLTARPSGAYVSETAWAGGGGFSHLYPRPAYQDGVPGIGKTRGVPDVAADADQPGWPTVFAGGSIVTDFGTSASAPLWGGLIALADQYGHHDLGFVNPAIYRIARSSSYHKAFHDITTGNNTAVPPPETASSPTSVTVTGYQAGPGWDPVTGWGSPDVQVLIPLLARGQT